MTKLKIRVKSFHRQAQAAPSKPRRVRAPIEEVVPPEEAGRAEPTHPKAAQNHAANAPEAPSAQPTPAPIQQQSAPAASPAVRRLARRVFGFETLRAGQEEAIRAVLSGHDTLAVMPTGSGKSAIYQLAALSLPGPTVVVSPLIALQQDQVESLCELDEDEGRAALLNSTLNDAEREDVLRKFEAGETEFLFLAPEQLTGAEVRTRLGAARPSLFVVDEAHCVSEWGFDFRPDYLRLGEAIEALGRPVVLALTATAAPPVRAEIVERLGMRAPRVVVSGFDRPNLDLAFTQFEDEGAREAALLDFVAAAPKPGLVYAATRKKAEGIAHELTSLGVRAAAYHAGMRAGEREDVQGAFMADDWEVVVATTAFGMGIDKQGVRFVAHADLPGSIDAYYQEIGRAGRDGEGALAHLFYCQSDLRLRKFFAQSSLIETDDLERLLRLLEVAGRAVGPSELAEESGFAHTKFAAALSRLQEVDAVRTLRSGKLKLAPRVEAEEAAGEAADAQENRREYERSRLEMMRALATTQGCRREFLLGYFGEDFAPPCGRCDNCRAGKVAARGADAPFKVGERVRHPTLGEGQVTHEGEGKVTVLFDDKGYQTLSLSVVLDNQLLEVQGGEG